MHGWMDGRMELIYYRDARATHRKKTYNFCFMPMLHTHTHKAKKKKRRQSGREQRREIE